MEITKNQSVAEQEEEGTTIEVRDAAGEVAEGVTITVVGSYSATYRKAQAANRGQWLKRRTREGEGDALERASLELTARCIKAWAGFTADGKDFPYSKENAIALLTNAPWIREQVEEAMNDHAGFFPKPLAS